MKRKPSSRLAALGMGALLAFIMAATLASWSPRAHAAPVAVSPVVFKMDAATNFGALRVGNPGESQAGVEIEAVRVRLDGGREVYEPAEEFTVTPPSFLLKAGENRLVRFRYSGPRTAMEGVYRIFVRQLPDKGMAGVSFAVNIGVPVFIAPTSAQPALALGPVVNPAEGVPAGSMQLRNTGNVTVTVGQLEGANCLAQPVKVGTRLFPKQAVTLAEKPAACPLTAQSDRGPITVVTERP